MKVFLEHPNYDDCNSPKKSAKGEKKQKHRIEPGTNERNAASSRAEKGQVGEKQSQQGKLVMASSQKNQFKKKNRYDEQQKRNFELFLPPLKLKVSTKSRACKYFESKRCELVSHKMQTFCRSNNCSGALKKTAISRCNE